MCVSTGLSSCELLVLFRNDFARVLQNTVKAEWDRCTEAMHKFSYFKHFDDVTARECCIVSRIDSYLPNETILGNGKGKKNFSYFIISGECKMIQHLYMAVHEVKGHKHFRLHSEEIPLKPYEEIKTYFMQVCLLNKLQCFGLGEDLKDRSIIATTAVECLLCPRHWLMQNSYANIWKRIIHFLDKNIPTREQLLKEFLMQRKWLAHREKLSNNILSKSKISDTSTFHDIPYYYRISDGYYFHSRKKV